MAEPECDIGLLGLGVMGRNLALNIAEHGFTVVGFDKDPSKGKALALEAAGKPARGAGSLVDLVAALRRPRAVLMLVPAGPPVDSAIRELSALLDPGDVIIDGGNSFFKDTDLRSRALPERGIAYLGAGISGGEHGARHGPSIMPGGPAEAYERVRPIFEAIAAQVNGEPCVAYLGPRSAGHYVKMVHNGIEYGLMRLIAETYDLLRRGLGFSDDDLHAVYARWNQTELSAYLLEITADIFLHVDERSGKRLIDVILDEAKQKGTGAWAVESALELRVPVPNIAVAVAMRDLSAMGEERAAASAALGSAPATFRGERAAFLEQLRDALYAGLIITFAQGLAQLRVAAQAYAYDFKLENVVRIWRGGCIIRAAVLERVLAAVRARPDLPNLLLDEHLGQAVLARRAALASVACIAADLGIPAPAMAAALAYLDGYRSSWLPANLIQAQRDYFGAHTYERVDAKGSFHTRWKEG